MRAKLAHKDFGRVFWLCAAVALCIVCSCSKSTDRLAAVRAAHQQDPELALENQIQKLLGEINSRQTEVKTLMRGAGPGLTPETRNKGMARRHEVYASEEYTKTLQEAQAGLASKFATYASGVPALENLKDTNNAAVVATPAFRAANPSPEELVEEMNLKARLIEIKALGEQLAILGGESENAAGENQGQAGVARPEPYSPEEYVATLRSAVAFLEWKVQGLDAEIAFYRDLVGLK